jgi:hypothetical protein
MVRSMTQGRWPNCSLDSMLLRPIHTSIHLLRSPFDRWECCRPVCLEALGFEVAATVAGMFRLVTRRHGLQPFAVVDGAARDVDDQGQSGCLFLRAVP